MNVLTAALLLAKKMTSLLAYGSLAALSVTQTYNAYIHCVSKNFIFYMTGKVVRHSVSIRLPRIPYPTPAPTRAP